MEDLLRFSIPGKPEYMKVVRLAIASVASDAGFNVEKIDDIRLAVEEACKAVICHGHTGRSNRYEISCEVKEDELEIMIKDSNEGHDLVKEKTLCANCPREGDIAPFVMDTLMDRFKLDQDETGSKTIVMAKKKV